jgi:hypothetical protein
MTLRHVQAGPEAEKTLAAQLHADADVAMADAEYHRKAGNHGRATDFIARAEALLAQARKMERETRE